MVLVVHTSHSVHKLSGWVDFASQYGQMGCQLFAAASAYTLLLTFVRRANERHALRDFWIRRFFRIAPLYYLAIPLYFMVHLAKQRFVDHTPLTIEPYTPSNVAANL